MKRPEVKEKLSLSLKGRKFSKEHREKLSKAIKGRKHNEETKKNISIGHVGRKHNEETKKNISNAMVLSWKKRREQEASLCEYSGLPAVDAYK